MVSSECILICVSLLRNGNHRNLHGLTNAFPARRTSDRRDRQSCAGPVAISAFADHMVKPRRSFGIGVKGLVIRAKVAGKEQARFANLHLDGSRSENVAGIPQPGREAPRGLRSEEHTSELPSLMRISYAVLRLKKKKHTQNKKRQTSSIMTN